MKNDDMVWSYLYSVINNPYGVSGMMGNLYAESKIDSINLQNSGNISLGLSDEEYTLKSDSGVYTNFVRDSIGYGIAQWTYWTRKQNLWNFLKSRNLSIGDLSGQLTFLVYELNTKYGTVLSGLRNSKTVLEASNYVLTGFEKPKNQSQKVQLKRLEYGLNYFNKYTGSSISISQPVLEKADSADYKDKEYNGVYKVSVNKLNLRKSPGKSGKIFAIMKKDETVRCYGYYSLYEDSKWLLVKYNNFTGYAKLDFLYK